MPKINVKVFTLYEGVEQSGKERKEALLANSFDQCNILNDFDSGWCSPFNSADFENIEVSDSAYRHYRVRLHEFSFSKKQLDPVIDRLKLEREMMNISLSKLDLAELKEDAVKHLKMNSQPKTTTVQISWDIVNGEVLIFEKSERIIRHCIDLFEKTFFFSLKLPEEVKVDPQKVLRTCFEDEVANVNTGGKITVKHNSSTYTGKSADVGKDPKVLGILSQEGSIIDSLELYMGGDNVFSFIVKESLHPAGIKIPIGAEELPEENLSWRASEIQRCFKMWADVVSDIEAEDGR